MQQVTMFLFLCLCALFGQIAPSAIPMWEFLSKQEKMSYLYSMFANQVEEFCENSKMADCNRGLLKYGLNKLKVMSEDDLDAMDPYQRDANNIIWESMMGGHEMMRTTTTTPSQSLLSTTTPKPNSYDDNSFGEFGAASAKIDNVYRVPPPKGRLGALSTGPGLYYPPARNPQYVDDYSYYRSNNNNNNKQGGPYWKFQKVHSLATVGGGDGPMVVRVHPDGSPVPTDAAQVPYDEDLRQYQLSKVKIPNF